MQLKLAFAVSLFAPAALAGMSPQEVSLSSERLGRPLPAYIKKTPTVEAGATQSGRIYAEGDPLTVFLNRFGGTYSCGNDDSSSNVSSVMCPGSGTVGDFSGSDTQWSSVRSCVQDAFSPFNLIVTDIEPTDGSAYVEAVIGGSPEDAGMPFGVGGVAPYDCSVIDRGVVYAFADVYGNDMQAICETAAQEIAHAFGLDHEFLCEDPMTYLGGCGDKSFQDTYAACGEFEQRECSCPQPGTGDTASQNSVQWMLSLFGASDGTPPPPPPDDQEVPVVSLVSPASEAVLQANEVITVVAEASDDIGLTVVELEWDYSGETFFCPGASDAWTCDRSGSTYTWQISVGEGSRTFRVHVRDVVGNDATTEDRTIWLSPDGQPPPQDAGPPSVFVATPSDGAVLPANETMFVVATIADDTGIARAELVWPFNDGIFPCPFETQGISCAVDGNTYTWSLDVGEGDRSFTVRATDLLGNVTESELRTIDLVPGADRPDEDGNDTIDDAVSVSCGESLELTSNDADWFSIDAPEGQEVTVVVDGQAAPQLELIATTGPREEDELGKGSDQVEFTAAGEGEVKVGVVPNEAGAGTYTLEVRCVDPTVTPPGGAPVFACSSTTGAGAAATWLGLLAVLGLRRRRR